MKIKALEPITAYGPDKLMLFTGEEAVISDTFANQLIDEGKAEEVSDGGGAAGGCKLIKIREYDHDNGLCVFEKYYSYDSDADEETLIPYSFNDLKTLHDSGLSLIAQTSSYYGLISTLYYSDEEDDEYFSSVGVGIIEDDNELSYTNNVFLDIVGYRDNDEVIYWYNPTNMGFLGYESQVDPPFEIHDGDVFYWQNPINVIAGTRETEIKYGNWGSLMFYPNSFECVSSNESVVSFNLETPEQWMRFNGVGSAVITLTFDGDPTNYPEINPTTISFTIHVIEGD